MARFVCIFLMMSFVGSTSWSPRKIVDCVCFGLDLWWLNVSAADTALYVLGIADAFCMYFVIFYSGLPLIFLLFMPLPPPPPLPLPILSNHHIHPFIVFFSSLFEPFLDVFNRDDDDDEYDYHDNVITPCPHTLPLPAPPSLHFSGKREEQEQEHKERGKKEGKKNYLYDYLLSRD